MEQESANSDYISFIRLLAHCQIGWVDNVDVSRIKKQLLAEFNLSTTGFIEVDGYSYSKETVLLELDSTDFANRLQFHKIIWENKGLLNLLEQQQFATDKASAGFANVQNNAQFDAFFSPYFANSFGYLSRKYVNNTEFNTLANLLRYRDFILPQHQEIAFKPLRIFIDEQLRVFNNISEENVNLMLPKITIWEATDWAMLLNNLPDTFFIDKESLIADLINLTVKLQKKHPKKALAISHQLMQLRNVSPENRKIIHGNHNVFSKSGGSEGGGGGSVVWGIIWLVIIVIRIGTGSSCNEKKDTKPYYYQNSDLQQRLEQFYKDQEETQRRSKVDQKERQGRSTVDQESNQKGPAVEPDEYYNEKNNTFRLETPSSLDSKKGN